METKTEPCTCHDYQFILCYRWLREHADLIEGHSEGEVRSVLGKLLGAQLESEGFGWALPIHPDTIYSAVRRFFSEYVTVSV